MNSKSPRVAVGAAFAVLCAAGAAHAATTSPNATLQGTFPFSGTIIGVTAPATGPTCPSTLAPGSIGGQLFLTSQGTWTFDGKGNMEANATGVLQTAPGTGEAADVSASVSSCAGTYTVNANHTVDMAYVCSLAGGYVQFVIQAHGVITPANILIAIPPAAGGRSRVLSEYVGGVLAACAVVGENTTVMRLGGTGVHWPVAAL